MLSHAIARMGRNLGLAGAVTLAVSGLAAFSPVAAAPTNGPLTAAASPAPRGLHRAGPWFIAADGKVVIMHGTNMINKLAPYTPDALGFGDDDLQFLADNGFNGIRLGLTWAAVEPTPGSYDDAYIGKLMGLAAAAADHGLIPVVNFHQDGYSEKFGGNGAPDWATLNHGVPGLTALPPPANVLPGAAIANESFWADSKASDGVGLQEHFAAAWKHVAERFEGDAATVFELYNEPSPGIVDVAPCALPIGCPLFDRGRLAPFYEKVIHAVRQADSNRLLMIEPTAFFGLGARTWLPSMNDPQVGFAYHNYCALALVPAPVPLPTLPCDVLTSLNQANALAHFRSTQETLLMNEFGAGDSDAVVAGLLNRADQHMLSWMHWAYWAQDFGKPATYGLINDPTKPPTTDNIKQGLLTVLTRPSPRLIAGTPLRWSWAPSAARFQASYSTARAEGSRHFHPGSVSEFFVHPRFFPEGYQVKVTGGTVTSAPNARRLTVAQRAGASAVSLTVTPAAH